MNASENQQIRNGKRKLRVAFNVLLASAIGSFQVTAAQGTPGDFHTGRSFSRAMTQTISGDPSRTVRSILATFSKDQRIAVIIGRRINPDKVISVKLQEATMREAFAAVAEEAGGTVSELSNVVFIGAPESTAKLRTLVRLKSKDVSKFANRRELRAKRTIVWPALSEPREVLRLIAKTFQVEVRGADSIPHDLWAAGQLPDSDAVTALSIVLIQFGLTFEWEDKGVAVRIVKEPESVVVQEKVRVTRDAPANLVELAKEKYPAAEITKSSRSYVNVKGTVEAIVGVTNMARGIKPRRVPDKVRVDLQQLTFTAKNARARDVFEKFKSNGIPIEWDEAELKAAGVDLDKLVELKVENATTIKTFRLLCDQIGADFTVEKYRVRLFSK